jgi:hypothetical protein
MDHCERAPIAGSDAPAPAFEPTSIEKSLCETTPEPPVDAARAGFRAQKPKLRTERHEEALGRVASQDFLKSRHDS